MCASTFIYDCSPRGPFRSSGLEPSGDTYKVILCCHAENGDIGKMQQVGTCTSLTYTYLQSDSCIFSWNTFTPPPPPHFSFPSCSFKVCGASNPCYLNFVKPLSSSSTNIWIRPDNVESYFTILLKCQLT